jgi:hypothetical protein
VSSETPTQANATTPSDWNGLGEVILSRYGAELLEAVAASVVKPRGAIAPEDRVGRIIGALDSPVVIDRRLRELAEASPAARHLLAVMAHARAFRMPLADAVSLVSALGHPDPLAGVRAALECGLVLPDLRLPGTGEPGSGTLHAFEAWLGGTPVANLALLLPPVVAARALPCPLGLPDIRQGEQTRASAGQAAFLAEKARREELGIPPLEDEAPVPVDPVMPLGGPIEADGFDIPCRLAALWQMAGEAPIRITQAGEFYRRDADRLRQNPSLIQADDAAASALPDPAGLLVDLARALGILSAQDADLLPGPFPPEWKSGSYEMLEGLYKAMFQVRAWSPRDGWKPEPEAANPFPSATLLALLLLAELPESAWVRPETVEGWIYRHHPFWKGTQRPGRLAPWVGTWLAGVAHPLRLVEMARAGLTDDDGRATRLTAIGRWLLRRGDKPPEPPVYPQALVVQPNLEVLVYRQALAPSLLARLTQVGSWRNLGNACMLMLDKDTVYRGLESGESLESIKTLLENHSGRAIPGPVHDQLKTWAGRRERLTVFPAATLLEFATSADLDEALARGVPVQRVGDRFAVLLDEAVGYKHVRIAGNRDYGLAPEPCLTVADDGATLTVDIGKSDLLLEIELPVLADMVEQGERRVSRITPASVGRAMEAGWSVDEINRWFHRRAGHSVTPAIAAMLHGRSTTATMARRLVLTLSSAELLDGLLQWPVTASCLGERLGPCVVEVPADRVEALRAGMLQLGMEMPPDTATAPS